MAKSGLEARLEEITRVFVAEIVNAIRSASFADVADLQVTGRAARPGVPTAPASKPTRVSASPKSSGGSDKPRQTAERRAELGERILKRLERAAEPMGVRALSSELGVAPDLLATPLLELRASGRIAKHGEKRATTYTIA
jgi:hypothetical protein